MGPYCKFCDRRCFVSRILGDGSSSLLATCPRGMEHDRQVLGEDHTTARNPAEVAPVLFCEPCAMGFSCAEHDPRPSLM